MDTFRNDDDVFVRIANENNKNVGHANDGTRYKEYKPTDLGFELVKPNNKPQEKFSVKKEESKKHIKVRDKVDFQAIAYGMIGYAASTGAAAYGSFLIAQRCVADLYKDTAATSNLDFMINIGITTIAVVGVIGTIYNIHKINEAWHNLLNNIERNKKERITINDVSLVNKIVYDDVKNTRQKNNIIAFPNNGRGR